jgi:hypothetical protein
MGNNFNFPFGRQPRIDRSNPVIARLGKARTDGMEGGIIAVCLPDSGMIDLVSGRGSTLTGSLPFKPHATLGVAAGDFNTDNAAVTFATGASDFAGKPVIAAAIAMPKSITNGWYTQPFIVNGNKWFSVNEGSMGGSFGCLSQTYDGVTVLTSTVRITANEPWFVMSVSQNSSAQGFYLARNLKTGQLLVDTTTGNIMNSQSGSDPNVNVGNRGSRGNAFEGWISAVAWVPNTFMTLHEAIRWSDDPWSLWYAKPPRPITVGVSGGVAQALTPPLISKQASVAIVTQA